jgi:Ca-activated chloride channel family protein
VTAPRIALRTEVHPLALARDDAECVATVRVDVEAPADAAVRPLNLALVIDRSGSMGGEKIDTARAAAARVIERMADGDVITVVAFSTEAEVIVPATRLRDGRAQALARVGQIQVQDQTNLARGLQAARSQMAPYLRPDHVNAVFMITDGLAGDADQVLQLGPELGRQGVLLYAAGIGADYNHEFIGQLCGKNRADHVNRDRLDRMKEMFDNFLRLEGHLVTAHARLFVTRPPEVQLQGVTSVEERGQPLQLDGQGALAVRDLAPGRRQSFQFELALTPAAVGRRPLAGFRLSYDLPAAGLTAQESRAEAVVEVTEDPARANQPNREVIQLARKIQTARLGEKAEADLANKDVRGATEKLERVTRKLEELGELDQAREVRERAEALKKASPDDLGLEIKKLRGTTKRLTQE